jgi:hypothetical protein
MSPQLIHPTNPRLVGGDKGNPVMKEGLRAFAGSIRFEILEPDADLFNEILFKVIPQGKANKQVGVFDTLKQNPEGHS